MSKFDDYAKAATEKLIKDMEGQKAPWQKGWEPGETPPGMGLPYNAVTGKPYSGMNTVMLYSEQQAKGYDDSRWMTYNQAQAVGAQVRKGEKGVHCVKWIDVKEKGEGEGSPDTVKPEDERSRKVPVLFTVFNAQQIDGLPEQQKAPERSVEWRHNECERLLKESGAQINHDGGNQAFYRPSTDSIHLPRREQFKSGDHYYSTALHELGHWTGHPTRQARDLTGKFGSESYAREELRAEIASMMMGQHLGIGHDPSNHVAYVKHWAKILREDPKEIFRAASAAEKICKDLGIEAYQREPMQILESAKADKEQSQEAVTQLRTRQRKPRAQEATQQPPKTKEQTQAPVAARQGRRRERDMQIAM